MKCATRNHEPHTLQMMVIFVSLITPLLHKDDIHLNSSGTKKLLLNLGLNRTYTVKPTEIGAQRDHKSKHSSTSHRKHTDGWTTVHGDKERNKKSSRYDNDLREPGRSSTHRHGQRVNSSDKNRDRTRDASVAARLVTQ